MSFRLYPEPNRGDRNGEIYYGDDQISPYLHITGKEVVEMIILTSISGENFCLNSDLIYKIEEAPDTIITLTDGKTLRVKNKTEDIIEKIITYKRQIFTNLLEGVK